MRRCQSDSVQFQGPGATQLDECVHRAGSPGGAALGSSADGTMTVAWLPGSSRGVGGMGVWGTCRAGAGAGYTWQCQLAAMQASNQRTGLG